MPQIPSKWFENITIINVEVSMYHLEEIWGRSFFIENFEISLKLLILPPDFSSKYQFSDRKCPQFPSKWFENITIVNVEVSMYHLKRFGVVQMDIFIDNFEISLKLLLLPPDLGQKWRFSATTECI